MITKAQLESFEMWFREYFDPEVEELPDPKYLHMWAVDHGEDLLKLLKEVVEDLCPSCNHPKCEARCDLHGALPYVSGKECPCCMHPNGT